MKIRFHRPVGGAEAAAVTIFPVVWRGGCAVVGGGVACYDRIGPWYFLCGQTTVNRSEVVL